MVSNTFSKSISIIPVKSPESKPISILSVRYERHVSVEWFLQNLNWFVYGFYCLLNTP